MEKRLFTRFWFIIAIAFLLVILFLIAWFISLEASSRDLYETYNQQQLILVGGAAGGIEGFLEDIAASLATLAARPEIQHFDETASRRELAQKMAELSSLGIHDIGILDANGTAKFFAIERSTEGVNFAWRSYFKAALATSPDQVSGNPIVEMQISAQDETTLTVAIPMFETALYEGKPQPSGDFAGIILGTLTLDSLVERYIAPFKPPGDGQISLMNQNFDIIWSSDPQTRQRNLLGVHQAAFDELITRVIAWVDKQAQGSAYIFRPGTGGESVQLVAYSPVTIAGEQLVVFVKTPATIARQTSLSTFRSQQSVFILSIITLLTGIIAASLVLRRETKRRFQTEEALRVSETKQAILAERNRLAGDLHDSVTQGLYGIVLHADAASSHLSKEQVNQAAAYLQEIKETGKESLAEMRLLIFELQPPVLENEGLVAAIETRLFAVEKRAGLDIFLDSQLEARLPKQVEEALYRIAQESFNNILKHAQAKSIHVCLDQHDQVVTMTIRDDGKGFDPVLARQGGGIGLTNMVARAKNIGGDLEFTSKPGQGTSIQVEVKI